MKQNVSPVTAAIVIVVVVAVVAGIYLWVYQAKPSAKMPKPPSMLPPQFQSMSTKDPVPPKTSAGPVQGGSLAPPGLGGGGPAIQSSGMMPGAPPGTAPSPPGMAPSPPGMAPAPR